MSDTNARVIGKPFTAETRPKGEQRGGRQPGYMAQRRLCEDILGKQGTKEYDEFVASTRRFLLAGVLPPGITTLLLHYGYGKPVDRIEVKEVKNEMEDLTEDSLRDRARRLAAATFIRPTPESGEADPTVQ